MPTSVRDTVLSAGAVLALGSMALVGAQIARPEEPRFVAEARAATGMTEDRIEILRRRLKLEPAAPPQWDRVAEALRREEREALRPALRALYEVLLPHQRRAAHRVFRGAVTPLAEGTPG